MTTVAGLVLTVLGAALGAWLQSRWTRRQWHAEIGADAWRGFVRGIHDWRAELDVVLALPVRDSARQRRVKKMERMIWDLEPDAPAIHVFGPPEVDRAARELLQLASVVVAALGKGEEIKDSVVEEIDSAKWRLVVAAAVSF